MKPLNLLILLLLNIASFGQGAYGAFTTLQGKFTAFEDGNISLLESLPPTLFKVGKTGIAYQDNLGIFKVYRQGVNNKINDLFTEDFGVTDNFIFYKTKNSLNLIDGNDEIRLTALVGAYAVGDSVAFYFDRVKNVLNAYARGKTYELENNLNVDNFSDYQVNDNIIAYNNFMNQFKIFYNGETTILENQSVNSFKVGRNTVAYVDVNGQFKIWHKGGEVKTIDPFPPLSYAAGDDLVAYVSYDGYFKIFYDGETTTMGYYNKRYDVKDFIVAYEDGNGFFKIFDRGMVYNIDNYFPEKIINQYNSAAYIDRSKTLRFYNKGKTHNISNLPTNLDDVQLNYDVLSYKIGTNMFRFFANGKEY